MTPTGPTRPPDRADPPGPPGLPAGLTIDHRGAICIAVLVAQGIYNLVTLFAIPSLIGTNPVLLELLRGSTAAMIAGGAFARVGRASLELALLAPLPTLMMSAPFTWWAGRIWGPVVADLLAGGGERGAKRAARAVRFVERFDSLAVYFAPILPIPTQIINAAAGWSGMRFGRFIMLSLAGTLTYVGLIVGLGYAIGHAAVKVAQDISHYGLYVTIGLVVVLFFYYGGSGAVAERRRPPASEPPEPR